MGNQFNNWKKSLDLLAVDTSRLKPPVRMPRVPASHISGGALPCPYSTTLKHLKKQKNHCMFESAASHRAQPLVRSSRFHSRLLAQKKYPKIEKNFSRYLTLTCKIQKKKKKNFSKNLTQTRKNKKKKKKKKKS